ncbi:MAG: 2'-5' RNA ligase family protein [Clostridia bacterium]|nr:2'-5' RNA ligase family protein [Clostridia bacterium]
MNYTNKGKRDILIIPKFNNIDKIQSIREKYDELFDKIGPHITLAFPFKREISSEQLKKQLLYIAKDFKPFKVKCKGISLRKDERVNTYYIFLNIVEGKEIINEINYKIYKNILNNIDIKKYNYEPHITLGNTNNLNEKIELNEEFETIINSIVVERIGDNEESIIEFEINL